MIVSIRNVERAGTIVRAKDLTVQLVKALKFGRSIHRRPGNTIIAGHPKLVGTDIDQTMHAVRKDARSADHIPLHSRPRIAAIARPVNIHVRYRDDGCSRKIVHRRDRIGRDDAACCSERGAVRCHVQLAHRIEEERRRSCMHQCEIGAGARVRPVSPCFIAEIESVSRDHRPRMKRILNNDTAHRSRCSPDTGKTRVLDARNSMRRIVEGDETQMRIIEIHRRDRSWIDLIPRRARGFKRGNAREYQQKKNE